MGSVEPRGQGRKDVPVNQRRGPSSSEKAGKSRADGNDFSTFSMKYKAQSLLKIMRDALVREKSKKWGEETITVQGKNSKQYYRSTQSPSKTQELTDKEVKKREEELHVQLKRVVQTNLRGKTTSREGMRQKRRDLAILQQSTFNVRKATSTCITI